MASAWNALLPTRLKEPAFRVFSRKLRVLRETHHWSSLGPGVPGSMESWLSHQGLDRVGGLQQATLESEAVEPCLAQSRGIFLSFIMVMSFFFF